MNISEMQKEAWKTSEEHGFHAGEHGVHVPTKLLLLIQEATEAFDEVRDGGNLKTNTYKENGKPEGFPSEIADIVIRAGDLAEIIGFDLEEAVKEKMAFNRGRPFMHGRKM